jgi:hypothetical protein
MHTASITVIITAIDSTIIAKSRNQMSLDFVRLLERFHKFVVAIDSREGPEGCIVLMLPESEGASSVPSALSLEGSKNLILSLKASFADIDPNVLFSTSLSLPTGPRADFLSRRKDHFKLWWYIF